MKAELLGTVPGHGPLKGRAASAVDLVTLDAEIVALLNQDFILSSFYWPYTICCL